MSVNRVSTQATANVAEELKPVVVNYICESHRLGRKFVFRAWKNVKFFGYAWFLPLKLPKSVELK